MPLPDAEARALSAALLEKLHAAIEAAGGCLPFDEFMNIVLYEPGLGYYSNGLTPFGEGGDFTTAPESGSLFGRCLAYCLASVLQQLEAGVVMEIGAGSGALAVDLLRECQTIGVLPEKYYILERSAAMRALQQETLSGRLPDLMGRVEWLEELPNQPFRGVVFANEVADALPVKRFRWLNGELQELGVGWCNNQLCERALQAGASMEQRIRQLACKSHWKGDYRSEYCPALAAWVNSLASCVQQGLLLLIDYGYGRTEYYHPQRSMGTLVCHYRHHAHDDPLWFPGLQDITAFVDFTTIAEAATGAGMRLEGFASQAQFLVGNGIDELLARYDPADARNFMRLSNEAKRLMLPGEMGERFKAIGFSRCLAHPVRGFGPQDLRGRL
jgi:SAM-dependent MidA family methyltransferase